MIREEIERKRQRGKYRNSFEDEHVCIYIYIYMLKKIHYSIFEIKAETS